MRCVRSDVGMAYQVEIAPRALRDIERAFLYLESEHPDGARRWLDEISAAILSLQSLPQRCPKARLHTVQTDTVVRVLLAGLSLPYKVFFAVVPGSNRSSGTVRVLHVRQALRRPWPGNGPA
jgi:plasmid stabilization system protein ParE